MLPCVTRWCIRSGGSASAHAALRRLHSWRAPAAGHRALRPPPGPLTPAAWARYPELSAGSPQRSSHSWGPADSKASPAQSPDPGEDSTSFGSLSAEFSARRSFKKAGPELQGRGDDDEDEGGMEEEEERGMEEDRPLRRPGRRNTTYWYFLQCKKLIKENKLQEALDMFHKDMLQGERLQPYEYNYSVLIGGCGRAGRLKLAFKLYNDMKKRGLVATDATYTALFNACAESPWKEAGLQQALKLEQELRRKNFPLSTITYHALLKTHAVASHLQACLHTIREMLQNGHVVTQETFHYLLMSSLKDKDVGFRQALQIWSQMLRSGLVPDAKNYNLLLRVARDCGIGDAALASRILLGCGQDRPQGRTKRRSAKSGLKNAVDVDSLERWLLSPPGEGGSGDSDGAVVPGPQEDVPGRGGPSQLVPVSGDQPVALAEVLTDDAPPPNLLDYFEGRRGAVVSLGTVSTASDRLALIGGAQGFLDKMAGSGLSPDLRTLTVLADLMEPGTALPTLLQVAKRHQVRLDLSFFNTVIRCSAKAGDLDQAKAVLAVLRQRHLQADIQTYGCLALGCAREKDGLQLLKDVQEAGLRPNVYIFSALIGRAAQRLDYIYLQKLLRSMMELDVWPNEVIIKQLEFAAQFPPNYDQFKSRNNYLVHINGFRGYYQQWLRAMPASTDEEPQLEVAVPQLPPDDGLSESERNMRAAARRYYTRKGKKKTASAV